MRFLVKTLLLPDGTPVFQALARGAMVSAEGVRVEEAEIEPEWFIHVWNCRAALAVELPDPKSPGTFHTRICDLPLPEEIRAAVDRDVEHQGSITWSGRYSILSPELKAFVAGPAAQAWLEAEARKLGLEPRP